MSDHVLLRRARGWLLPEWRYDTRPIVFGLVVTLVFTVCAHFAAILFPTEALRMWVFHRTGTYHEFDNPIRTIEFLGGLIGGAVAGYHTASPWIDAGVNGLAASVLGIVGIWVIWAGLRLAKAVFVWRMLPPVLEVFVIPLLILTPFVLFNLVLGFAGGVAGSLIR